MLRLVSLTGYLLLDIGLVLFVIYLVLSIRSYYRLSHIPGPKLWGWSILPLFTVHTTGGIFEKFHALNDRYGPLVRVAPNTLLCSDPEVIKRMNAPRSPYLRAQWYVAVRLAPGVDTLFSTRDEKLHDRLRKTMAFGYSGKENLTLESDIDKCMLDFVKLIDQKYISENGKFVNMDLARKVQFLTIDIMSKLAFDTDFHDLRDDKDNFGYINEVETVFPNIFATCTIPSFVDFLTRIGLLQLFSPEGNSKMAFGKVIALAKAQVGSRFGADGKPIAGKQDMLGSFINHGLTKAEAERESVIQLVAGSDTSATTMRATLLALMTNPRAYRKLVEEIDAAVAAGKIASGDDEIISDAQARELPYLQACIKEGLRWFPVIGGLIPKLVPPQGDTICGYFVPEGTSVGYSAKAIHCNPVFFGPDPKTFRPERWILESEGGDEVSSEKLKKMEWNNDMAFGSGRFQCLGRPVAQIELNKFFVELLRRFDISLVDQLNPWNTACYGIHLQKDLWVHVRRRGEPIGI